MRGDSAFDRLLAPRVAQLTPRAVRRDSELNFDSSPVSDAVSRRELDEALAVHRRFWPGNTRGTPLAPGAPPSG